MNVRIDFFTEGGRHAAKAVTIWAHTEGNAPIEDFREMVTYFKREDYFAVTLDTPDGVPLMLMPYDRNATEDSRPEARVGIYLLRAAVDRQIANQGLMLVVNRDAARVN